MFEPPRDGDVLVSADVGPHGELVTLWAAEADREALHGRTVAPSGVSHAHTRTERPVTVRVCVHYDDTVHQVEIDKFRLAHPSVQPLPDGRLLAVGARCRSDNGGPERNAVVYDERGRKITAASVGDGVNHVRTTPSGAIWVGYFDEGITGIGAPGIVRFDQDLQVAWRFPVNVLDDGILDCYALNSDGENIWACTYPEFPVIRIDGERVTSWRNRLRGVDALITDGRRCALVGGYGSDRDRLMIGQLDGGGYNPRDRRRLVTPPGDRIAITGRCSTLHVVAGHTWWTLDLADL
ncbi:hypothetical protein EV193_111177 [Herbihabitans rhizosphaerae]|uniref:Uncharacterized protein n=1 Tax=Herbihabitans rhizosphaerae TaxID=1872711 RepID=A0A4Q7KFX9_9PSEU|nr:hypothetical protein EV193_111177 [Herbihabitans rhizosphaerae]